MTIQEASSLTHLAALDAELLMAHVLEKDRTFILAHGGDELSEVHNQQFQSFVRRRAEGEPVAYILGEKEFYGRAFAVDKRVLLPRPSTERLVDIALGFLEHPKNSVTTIDTDIIAAAKVLNAQTPTTIVDIGTGSGCIAITLKLEGRSEKIIGVDASQDALDVARTNGIAWGVEIDWKLSDGIEFVTKVKQPFLVVSNPPYVPEGMELPKDVSAYEPQSALFSGPDGLSVIRPLIETCEKNPMCTGYVIEMREDQLSGTLRP